MLSLSTKATLTLLTASVLMSGLSEQALARSKSVQQLIKEGLKLRAKREDQAALERFQTAYERSKSPRALAQVALAHQALGNWVEAELALVEALSKTKNPWIRARRRPLTSALSTIQSRLATLEVVGEPEGASVTVNGEVVGALPLEEPLRVVAGTLALDVEAEGYRSQSRSLTLRAGSTARERMVLVKHRPKLALAETSALPRTDTAEPTLSETSIDSASSISLEAAPPRPLQPWAWISGGTSLALIGGGVVATLIRNDRLNRYNDDSICLVNGLSRQENCGSDLDAANTAEGAAIAGFIGGGVLAATSITLFLIDSSTSDNPTSAGQSASGAGGAGLACVGGLGPSVSCQLRF